MEAQTVTITPQGKGVIGLARSVEIVAENVRRLRDKRRMSRMQLAAIAEVHLNTIVNVEGGKGVSLDTLETIAAALDVAIAELLRPTAARKGAA